MISVKGLLVVCLVVLNVSAGMGNPFTIFKRHSIPGAEESTRQGRNSKLMNFGHAAKTANAAPLSINVAEQKEEEVEENLEVVEKEAEEALIKALIEDTETVEDVAPEEIAIEDLKDASLNELEDAVADVLINDVFDEDQEDRGGKQGEDKLGLTADQEAFTRRFNEAAQKVEAIKTNRPSQDKPVFQLRQPAPQQQYQQQYNNNNNYQYNPYNNNQNSNQQYNNGQNTNQQYNQQYNYQYPAQQQQQEFIRPSGNAQPRSGLDNNFGINMGDQAIADPDNNNYINQPQLERLIIDGGSDNMQLSQGGQQIRQADAATGSAADTTVDTSADATADSAADSAADSNADTSTDTTGDAASGTTADATTDGADASDAAGDNTAPASTSQDAQDDLRCINKVMQVEETVYDDIIKCQHRFTEKCHDTFITEYVATQEERCQTSFMKSCHITYTTMVTEEKVTVCDEPLVKVCGNGYQGPEICKTHWDTTCETRYKEHEVEQDEPVCEMVIEKKCSSVKVPLLEDAKSRRRRQTDFTQLLNAGQLSNINGNYLNEFALRQSDDSVSVGEECEDWPIQKCRLEKRIVKKSNPQTECRKTSKQICAPDNCQFKKGEKQCRDEMKQSSQLTPSEKCGLDPRENCKMETIMIPKLIPQKSCSQVPKEICHESKSNPRKVKKPVVKQWCYKPSDLKNPSSRQVLTQYFN